MRPRPRFDVNRLAETGGFTLRCGMQETRKEPRLIPDFTPATELPRCQTQGFLDP